MDRLTFDGNFCDIAQCRELLCPQYGFRCTQRKVWEKLKAYEDTGLTPKLVQETAEFAIWIHENGLEKIKEWVKADKEGRLVVLPESKEHPRKTRQDVLLDRWPETRLLDGIIDIKPCSLVASFRSKCPKTFCYDCRREFWMQEAE